MHNPRPLSVHTSLVMRQTVTGRLWREKSMREVYDAETGSSCAA